MLTIVALNMGTRDAVFEPVRAVDPDRIQIVHAEYRTSWAEVSARRRKEAAAEPEDVADTLHEALARADVLFAFVVPRRLPALAPRLRWLATPATGIDHLRGCQVLESTITVTTVGGLFGPIIAEHVLAAMLYFAKRLPLFAAQQGERRWQTARLHALAGRTVGIVGVGSIGSAVGRLAQAFGMHVLGIGRSDPAGRQVAGIDTLLPRSALTELLGTADYVVLAVADTPETLNLIGARELATMKREAVLINVARGTVIDEGALAAALESERIAGAALDVFAREPLPTESRLWRLPNVLVTPHVATNVPEYLALAAADFADNVRRFLAGEPLRNQFDRARGY